jgi:hypothetical protein
MQKANKYHVYLLYLPDIFCNEPDREEEPALFKFEYELYRLAFEVELE